MPLLAQNIRPDNVGPFGIPKINNESFILEDLQYYLFDIVLYQLYKISLLLQKKILIKTINVVFI